MRFRFLRLGALTCLLTALLCAQQQLTVEKLTSFIDSSIKNHIPDREVAAYLATARMSEISSSASETVSVPSPRGRNRLHRAIRWSALRRVFHRGPEAVRVKPRDVGLPPGIPTSRVDQNL